MKIAYLINQYPKVSHSFIRREIAAVENCGIEVARFSIRSCEPELVDPMDKQEQELTEVVLGIGIFGLVFHLITQALRQPGLFVRALTLAWRIGWRSDRGIILHLAYLAEACYLRQRLSDLGVTHLHAHFGTNSATVALLCRVLGGPAYSFTVHGPEEFDKATVLALTEKIQHAAFTIAISSFGKSQLYRWCPQELWSTIHVVHCGLDQDFLSNKPSALRPQTPRLVCVGRLSEQKGHLLLLDAAALVAQNGVKFELVFVGDGPLRPQIEARATALGLETYLKITGWASAARVQEELLAARALVLPSFAEGLPVVIMEALALERPVISTYVAGIPELVEPGVCGWLVPAGDAEALANAMQTALAAPREQLEKMGKAGAQRVAERHDAATEARKLVSLFKK